MSDEPSLDLLLAEYGSMRAEALAALSAQQSILAWSIGAIGVVIAAAVSLVDHPAGTGRPIELAILGFALPALTIGSSLAWIGELIRGERGAVFLRGLERGTWSLDRRELPTAQISEGWVVDRRLLFTNFITYPGGKRIGEFRQTIGYIGGAIIYGGTLYSSLGLFAWLLEKGPHPPHEGWRVAGLAWAIGLAIGYALVAWAQLLRLLTMSVQSAGVPPYLLPSRPRLRDLLK